ncbi:MAG: ABC transporter permease subunit [Oscillospiraceae bacterium]|nr:ABC transporter permease subunit [Oscillospiraceae bacterium]
MSNKRRDFNEDPLIVEAIPKKIKFSWKLIPQVIRHLILAAIALFWLIPIIWLVFNSFSEFQGMRTNIFFPESYSFTSYRLLLFDSDSTVARFPVWFMNTLQIAIFSALIASIFVLMVSYAMSRMRFRGRRSLMSFGVILGLFPGFLAMIAVYFIMRSFGLTNNHWGLVLIYSGSSGLGYLIAKGFFDTISETLSESARIDGATEAQVFRLIIIPLSKPIIVYTVISAFLVPWMDFMFASIMLNSGIATDWTVAMGLFRMLQRELISTHFARFCAGGVIVSIPISILFVIMQKFYVEGITGGAVKG